MKQKLIKLVNACLDDKLFYNPYLPNNSKSSDAIKKSAEKITSSGSVRKEKLIVKYEHHFLNNLSKTQREMIYDRVKKLTEGGYYEYDSSELKIAFLDLPPIFISVSFEKNMIVKEIFPLSYIRTKKKRVWLFFSKNVKTVFGKQEIALTCYEHPPRFCITSGSLKIKITEEEYKGFIQKFQTNKKKFIELIDEKKVDERIKKYVPG